MWVGTVPPAPPALAPPVTSSISRTNSESSDNCQGSFHPMLAKKTTADPTTANPITPNLSTADLTAAAEFAVQVAATVVTRFGARPV